MYYETEFEKWSIFSCKLWEQWPSCPSCTSLGSDQLCWSYFNHLLLSRLYEKASKHVLLDGLAFSNSHWKEVREIYTMPLRLPLASCSSSDRLHNGCTGNHTSGSSHWWLWWPLGKKPCRVGQSFINILQAAFATKLICQKNSKPNYN